MSCAAGEAPPRRMKDVTKTPPTVALNALDAEGRLLRDGDHPEPHRLLGAHPSDAAGLRGAVVRAFHPDAAAAWCLLPDGRRVVMTPGQGGIFEALLPEASLPLAYRLRFKFPSGASWERDDPYRFLPTLGEVDLHLIGEGTHRRLWERLGARRMTHEGVDGVAFAVWAPNARRVSVVGEFCGWDGRLLPMRRLGAGGVFELFIPGLKHGDLYKFEIKTADGRVTLKADPMARWCETPPRTASRVHESDYAWGDEAWTRSRAARDVAREPMLTYELHLNSWRRVAGEHNRPLTYRELAAPLIEHLKRLRMTHVELMPVAEHPFIHSWGYQVTGYYAPTSRYGTPDDFRHLIDECHRNGIGVILDWVPAHFPRDDFALRRFDGTALYEHEDARLGEHPDWGTLIFNYERHEVRNFLLANALYWLKEFHLDGLRVDAVASMLYLDYSRRDGAWIPNIYGGKENLGAIGLLRAVNEAVREECPGCFTIAEESTGWSGVTRPASQHGLGFTFKWNMGWMHDTLAYFSRDPVHRRFHHNDLTFAMLYEHSERFLNPLSHDEVVHGKRSLLEKMPGDLWQKFANLRTLLAYQYTRPGKKLIFMGTELAPHQEWYCDAGLDWGLGEDPWRRGLMRFMQDLGAMYAARPCLWYGDPDPSTFAWIDCHDREQSVLSYLRRQGSDLLVIVLNLTPVPRDGYRIGVPPSAGYVRVLSSDDAAYAGSGYPCVSRPGVEAVAWHGFHQSVVLNLPPLAALVLAPEDPARPG